MTEIIVAEMTRKQAEEAIACFTQHWTAARAQLLTMFEGKAHKALGYGSFAEFAQDRLGINVGDRTIDNHLAAARVDRNLSVGHSTKSAIVALFVPLKAALELNKLPDEEQPEAWKEVKTLESYGTTTPKDIARALRDIVARRLNNPGKPTEVEQDHGTLEDTVTELPDIATTTAFVPDLRTAKPAVIVEDTEGESDDFADKETDIKPVYNVRPPQDVQLHFCEAIFELRYVRIDCKLPNGNPAFVLVPKGCLK